MLSYSLKYYFLKNPVKFQHIQNVIKSTDCSEETLWPLFDTLRTIDGNISFQHLRRLMTEDGKIIRVKLTPENIEVFHIESVIASKVITRKDLKVERVKVMDSFYVIGLRKWSDIQF